MTTAYIDVPRSRRKGAPGWPTSDFVRMIELRLPPHTRCDDRSDPTELTA